MINTEVRQLPLARYAVCCVFLWAVLLGVAVASERRTESKKLHVTGDYMQRCSESYGRLAGEGRENESVSFVALKVYADAIFSGNRHALLSILADDGTRAAYAAAMRTDQELIAAFRNVESISCESALVVDEVTVLRMSKGVAFDVAGAKRRVSLRFYLAQVCEHSRCQISDVINPLDPIDALFDGLEGGHIISAQHIERGGAAKDVLEGVISVLGGRKDIELRIPVMQWQGGRRVRSGPADQDRLGKEFLRWQSSLRSPPAMEPAFMAFRKGIASRRAIGQVMLGEDVNGPMVLAGDDKGLVQLAYAECSLGECVIKGAPEKDFLWTILKFFRQDRPFGVLPQ